MKTPAVDQFRCAFGYCSEDRASLFTVNQNKMEMELFYHTPNLLLGDQFLLLSEEEKQYVGPLFETPGLHLDFVPIRIIWKSHRVFHQVEYGFGDIVASNADRLQHRRIGGVAVVDALERDRQRRRRGHGVRIEKG